MRISFHSAVQKDVNRLLPAQHREFRAFRSAAFATVIELSVTIFTFGSTQLPATRIPLRYAAMKTVTVQTAKADFDSLLSLVRSGETIEIAEADKTFARLVPVTEEVDWSGTFAKLNEIWGPEPLPGKPASSIVIENRR